MNDKESYLFDLQGFLVIPQALTPEAVGDLNAILDEHIENESEPEMKTQHFRGLFHRGKPYLDLIDNPRTLP